MSYHELSQQTANECSQAAFAYHPDCYCAFYFTHADYPPRQKYRHLPAKYLQVLVWRATPEEEADRFVLAVNSETGADLLRQLRYGLDCFRTGTWADPSLWADADLSAEFRLTLRHPLLPAATLHRALGELADRLPRAETRALTDHLRAGITERQQQAHQPAPGGGWVPTAPQTTQPLTCWPH